jgi:hypothetical protein
MKIYTIKSVLLSAVVVTVFSNCTNDDDFEIHPYRDVIFSEDFSKNAVDNQLLITPDWLNIAQIGSVRWKTQIYQGNAYAEFTSYQSQDVTNIGWLISPEIDMDQHENEILQFQTAQSFVSSAANSLQVMVCNDFDGVNVENATWILLNPILPTTTSAYYEFIKSGEVDLSAFTGKIRLGFKVKGGKDTAIDGTYQVDNIRIIY